MSRRFLSLLLAGILFGAGLALSGMTNPAKVIGFLDVTGRWDPTLAFVMGGAVGTFGIGLLVWRARTGGRGWFGHTLPTADKSPIDRPLLLGTAIFGVGWGLSGFCPGPALVNFGALRLEALIFVPAMAAGMLLARLVFGADRD
jgi:uncharacterized membrane protein YedE/YeeE